MSDMVERLANWIVDYASMGATLGDQVQEVTKALREEFPEVARLQEDGQRLDWLDNVNAKTNERNGTRYGWKYDINHNRAALTDHNFPPLSVREAIDAVRLSPTHKTQRS